MFIRTISLESNTPELKAYDGQHMLICCSEFFPDERADFADL